MNDIYQKVAELVRNGDQGVLVTITEISGSTPRHTGSKMIVKSDGDIVGSVGGGALEAQAIEEAVDIQKNGTQPGTIVKKVYRLTEDEGMLCGGQAEVLFESFGLQEHLVIFGAGHIARALAPLGKQAGFYVTVLDNRSEYATTDRFPTADDVQDGDYEQLVQRVKFHDRSYVVVVTHGHQHDEEVLEQCIRQPHAYIGMIGSRNKSRTIIRHLKEQGLEENYFEKVYSPVGLNIGAETPFEIAVSILAEIIAIRRGVDISHVAMTLYD